MAGVTTCMTDSFRQHLMTKSYDFTTTTGDVFKVALFVANASISGTYNKGTTNYSQMGSDELATATGYTRPGFAFTAAQNTTPTVDTDVAITTWSVNPNWTTATFTTRAAMIYDSTASGASVSLHDFGSDQTVSSGTFTLVLPTANSTSAILRLA